MNLLGPTHSATTQGTVGVGVAAIMQNSTQFVLNRLPRMPQGVATDTQALALWVTIPGNDL